MDKQFGRNEILQAMATVYAGYLQVTIEGVSSNEEWDLTLAAIMLQTKEAVSKMMVISDNLLGEHYEAKF